MRELAGLLHLSGGGDRRVTLDVAADGSWVRINIAETFDRYAFMTPEEARFIARKLNHMARVVAAGRPEK